MKSHPFYALYPAREVDTIGVRKGYFDDLSMYCGMAFDPSVDVSNLYAPMGRSVACLFGAKKL